MNEVKEIFKVGKRMCVVIKMSPRDLSLRGMWEDFIPAFEEYHNGYVQTLKKNYGKDYEKFVNKLKTEELTFAGNWDDEKITEKNLKGAEELKEKTKGKWFFGFDSAHYWNDLHPKTKTFKSVKKRTIKLAKEMIKKGI